MSLDSGVSQPRSSGLLSHPTPSQGKSPGNEVEGSVFSGLTSFRENVSDYPNCNLNAYLRWKAGFNTPRLLLQPSLSMLVTNPSPRNLQQNTFYMYVIIPCISCLQYTFDTNLIVTLDICQRLTLNIKIPSQLQEVAAHEQLFSLISQTVVMLCITQSPKPWESPSFH